MPRNYTGFENLEESLERTFRELDPNYKVFRALEDELTKNIPQEVLDEICDAELFGVIKE